MAGNTTRLMFELFGRDNASPVFDKFGRRVRTTADDIGFMTKATKGLVTAAAGYATFDVARDFLAGANEEAREAQKVNALTANALKTTGAEAWTSASAIADYAGALSVKNAVDDETIQSASNLLLTFKRVRNEVGAGSDIFNRATAASVDLSASGFGSIDGAAKMLGKSLNDPLKGITALGRAGVTFTQGQKDQIKTLVEQNDLLGAQKVILGEVESQVKGSAAAQATAGEKAQVAWDNAQEAIGTALLPMIDELAEAFADKALPAGEAVSDWLTGEGIPAMRDFYAQAKPVAADVLPAVAAAGESVVDVFQFLAPLVGDVAGAFSDLPSAGQQAILLGAGVALLGNRVQGLMPDLTNLEGGFDRSKAKAAALRGGIGLAGVGLAAFGEQVSGGNKAIEDTASILGNAAVGFSVAGPWGAAVGAGVGIVQSFADSNRHAVADVDALTASLDEQTGSLTDNTTELLQNALEKDGAYKKAREMGVNLGDVTDAAAGDKGALSRITAQRDAEAKRQGAKAEKMSPGSGSAIEEGIKRNFDELTDSIAAQSGEIGKARQKWENLNDSQRQSKTLNKLTADQVRDVTKATEGIPKSAVTKFTQPGYVGAVKNVADIARRYDLTPKQVETTMKTLDYSSADIRKVLRLMKDADAAKANPKVDVDTGDGLARVRQIGTEIRNIKGKTVAIKVTGGRQLASADGNVLFFADGGSTRDIPNGHEPEIAWGGTSRVWNEPETGGEVYFPLAPAKRARSQQIAARGVELLGGEAHFAAGGFRGGKKRFKAVRKVAEAVTVEDLANRDTEPSISAYDAVGQRSFADRAGEIAGASKAEHDRLIARMEAFFADAEAKSKKSRRRSASERSADRRANSSRMDGATVEVRDGNRSMRGVIRTRG